MARATRPLVVESSTNRNSSSRSNKNRVKLSSLWRCCIRLWCMKSK